MSAVTDILAIKNHLAAYHLVVQGEFDKEIARLEALSKEVAARMGLVKTIDDAKAQAAFILKQADDTLADYKNKLAKVEVAITQVKEREKAADVKQNAARELELVIQSGWNELTKARADHASAVAAHEAAAAETDKALSVKASEVAAREAKVEARAAKISSTLKTL